PRLGAQQREVYAPTPLPALPFLLLGAGTALAQAPEETPPEFPMDSSPGTIGTPVYEKLPESY
ncbi:MAG: hypothetical protein ACI9X4_001325, partial [Glaciecola sp.]